LTQRLQITLARIALVKTQSMGHRESGVLFSCVFVTAESCGFMKMVRLHSPNESRLAGLVRESSLQSFTAKIQRLHRQPCVMPVKLVPALPLGQHLRAGILAAFSGFPPELVPAGYRRGACGNDAGESMLKCRMGDSGDSHASLRLSGDGRSPEWRLQLCLDEYRQI